MTEKREIVVEDKGAGKRLDIYLSSVLEEISRSQIQKLIDRECICVNGNTAQKKYKVNKNDKILIQGLGLIDKTIHLYKQNISLEIIYEDEYFAAINKPAGMVVHPGNGIKSGTLVNALLFHMKSLSDGNLDGGRPGIVHRLDKNTSGVILIAKSNRAHEALSSIFRNRQIQKHYLGLCIGVPHKNEDIIDMALDRSRNNPLKRAPSVRGKVAKTAYKIIAECSGISFAHFRIFTGRTHQIRVHSSTIGFPILCDPLYGGGKERLLRVSPLERPMAYCIYKCFDRHALHAYSIRFIHPFSNKKIRIDAALPEDFKNALTFFRDSSIEGIINNL